MMKKTVFRTAALMLATIISVMAFAACSTADKQTGLTKEYFQENKTEILVGSVDYSKIFGVEDNPFEALSNNLGSVTVSFTEPESGVSVSVGANVDEKNAKGSVDVDVTVAEETVDLSVYYDKEKFALASDMLLGEGKAYGVSFDSFDNIIGKFDKSALASMLGLAEGDLAAFCEMYGINQEYFDGIVKAFGDYAKLQNEYTLEKMIADVYEMYESSYGEVAEETIEVNGERKEALSLEIKCDKQLFATAFDWYYGLIEENNTATKELITAFIPVPMREEMIPDIEASYDETLSLFKEEFDSILDAMDISGTMKIYIDKATRSYIMEKADLTLTVDGETAKVVVSEYLADNGMVFEGTVTVDEETINISGGITVEDDENGTKWLLNVDASNPEYEAADIDMAFEYSKADGSYRLYMDGVAEEEKILFEINGKLSYTQDSLEMTVENIKVDDGYTSEELPISIVYKASTKPEITEPAEYVEILDMSENDLYAVIGRIGMAGGKLSSMMYGDYSEPDFYDEYEYEYSEPDFYDEYEYEYGDVYGEEFNYEDYALSYEDYEAYADYYTYEEFCEFVDAYNAILAER